MNEMMEFQITGGLPELRQQLITTNAAQVKEWAREIASRYSDKVVAEEEISTAKSERAALRKVQSNVHEVAKIMKDAALATIAQGTADCKEIEAILQTGVDNLDGQLKAFEEAKKKEKDYQLASFFAQNVGEMSDYLSYRTVFNPRWLNATYNEEQAHKDILAAIATCAAGVGAIRSLKSPFETELLNHFRETGDIAATLKKNEQLTTLHEIEERRRLEREAEAEKAKATAEATKAASEAVAQQHQESAANAAERMMNGETVTQEQQEEPKETLYTIDFRVICTSAQVKALKEFLTTNGIKYGPVKN